MASYGMNWRGPVGLARSSDCSGLMRHDVAGRWSGTVRAERPVRRDWVRSGVVIHVKVRLDYDRHG